MSNKKLFPYALARRGRLSAVLRVDCNSGESEHKSEHQMRTGEQFFIWTYGELTSRLNLISFRLLL